MKLRLPELNERLGIVVADGRMLTTRVEDVQDAELLVPPPSDQGVTYLMSRGEEVKLEWTTERGLLQASGSVVARVEGGVPLVRIRVDETSVIQRREYVRVECCVNVDVRFRGDRIAAESLDLSGSGVRVLVNTELVEEDIATLVLHLPDGDPIETRAFVVRVDGKNVYAFQFLSLGAQEQERIIRWVFDTHRRQYATIRKSA